MPDVFLFVLLLTTFNVTASGQAWVPSKGEGTASTSFDYLAFAGHVGGDGSRAPEAASILQSYLFGVEYGVTDKLAIALSVPVVSARYASDNPTSAVLRTIFDQAIQTVNAGFYNHPFLDDENYHTTLQDFHFDVRYNLMSRPVVLTPFLGATFPSHDYAFVGEASPGRNLKEFRFGADAARVLDPFLHKAYVDGQLSFTIPEQALQVRTNRTNLSLEMGYSLTRKLALRGVGQWQHTFNGLQFATDLTTPELSLTHERLLKASYWHLGGGLSYALNSKTDVSADVVTFLSGSDTHYGTGLAFTISRSFRLKTREKPALRPNAVP